MARITYVKAARARKPGKAPYRCAKCGKEIQVGEPYKWFANRIGRSSIRKNYCSQHSPRPSDMTTSDKLSQLYAIQEGLQDDIDSETITIEDIASNLETAAEGAREVGQEYEESADNIEEGFGHSIYQSDEIREKAEACEEWADALEQAATEVRDLDEEEDDEEEPEEDEEVEEEDDALDQAREIVSNVIGELNL